MLNVTDEGITLIPPGSTVSWPTVATASGIERAASRIASTRSGGGDERILAAGHRRRSRVAGTPGNSDRRPDVADDPRHDRKRRPKLLEPRSLLDVELHEGVRQRA